ncbi:DNA polymerase III subunit alpha [[Mycoplasma] collis]|uniref:DNA polymerase III subunit alpha n=1 Tax=[Mycoplasma] collis TaxID=2127 RepID=UPI00051ABE89|nr:DNA polymerase III subunit alpha [[Mycoplasma] collis]
MTKFINLNTHTEYSFLESTIKINSLFDYAIKNNLTTLAITDRNNMFGVPFFLKKAKENNIKPIIGVDLDVEDYRFILLAKNYAGYQFLLKLVSKINKDKKIELSEIYNENIFIIDHPDYGIFAKTEESLNFSNYYISTNDININNSIYLNETKILNNEEKEVLDLLKSISKKEFNTNKYLSFEPVKKIDDIIINRINKIISEINIIFPEKENFLPKFANDENLSSDEYLKKIIFTNLKTKESELKKYKQTMERLNYEFNVIKNLNFSDYFLIIWDLIKWAKENNILVGPGRGSVSGSLIAFILNITEVNPLKYNLYFERFLNPERISMPDIDIDVADDRRDEVLLYLKNKYGFENFSTIITFQTLGAKMSLRDTARVYKLPVSEVNELTKRMFNDSSSLEVNYEKNAKFKAKINSNELYFKIYNMARKIENLPRQHGTHAAGIIISKTEIENVIPTLINDKNFLETQFSMEYLEDFGFLKIDILALKNLSIINEVLNLINEKNKLNLTFKDIPLFDLKTNELLTQGKTVGIFQLESPGMKNTLKNVGISSLEDLASVISLFRPGPIEYINEYAKRKKTNSVPQVSEEYDAILASTYGIIVYQEQIMEICQKVANFSFAQADIFRKAISKKESNEMSKYKDIFIANAIKQNYDEKLALKIFRDIEYFAEYGFNKAHAISYAMLAYKMAYLKSKFPLFFFASLINNARGSQEAIKKYIDEAKEYNIKIHSPSVNAFFKINDNSIIENDEIFLPLITIKGLGNVATKKILEIRKEKKFSNLQDFLIRMNENKVTKNIINILIESNSLREFGVQKYIKSILNIFDNEETNLDFDKDPNLVKEYLETFKKEAIFTEVNDEKDIEEIQKNELNYLGMTFTTNYKKNYEYETRLIDLKNNNKYVLPLKVLKISPFYDKNKRLMAKLELMDSSKQIVAFIFSSYWQIIENKIDANKIYEFEIMLNSRGYTIYKMLKEIYEK